MPSHSETKILPYSAKQIFDLVMDIEKYPQFLPWCLAAKITQRFDENHINADLVISFKGFSQKYSSDIKTKKIGDEEFLINVVAIDGPFKNLVNKWEMKELKDASGKVSCQVKFFIDFEFKSIILGKMIGLIFEKATDKMIDAFEKRAEIINN
ncbi:MAG: Oligoketide cyclase/lipid transport protein [Rickettsiaceae bacterium]|jgi:coenzyme Q-binding protein COQ10|nr:Oligoketide cyclase/lipid transport protein [Rickettsiaceae bacterium]